MARNNYSYNKYQRELKKKKKKEEKAQRKLAKKQAKSGGEVNEPQPEPEVVENE